VPALPDDVVAALVRMGLVDADRAVDGESLTGGVSSEIWRVDTARGPVCVKRALGRLKVSAVWEASVERGGSCPARRRRCSVTTSAPACSR
jgi:hypothetical protein